MISLLSTTFHSWRARPIWAANLLVLITIIMFGGPAACVMHCMLLDAADHQRSLPQHSLHGHHSTETQPVCPAIDQHSEHGEHAEPNALTVAIVLPLALLPQLLAQTFRLLIQTLRSVSIALPPPRHPPRLAHS